jgi:hypothetical protein
LWSNTTLNSYESLTIFVSPLNFETLNRSSGSAHAGRAGQAIRKLPRDRDVVELFKSCPRRPVAAAVKQKNKDLLSDCLCGTKEEKKTSEP